MTNILNQLALASRRAAGLRSFQLLSDNDLSRVKAFFLSFDFDQRRACFGGGISDHSIHEYCDAIDWDRTTLIARSGPYCLEAVAILASLASDRSAAELSVACPLLCNQNPIIAELLDLAIEIASLQYEKLIVNRELANPDLMSLLRNSDAARFDCEDVQVDLAARRRRTAAC
jgi:hypothetical protein